jgi:Fe-S-cluster containining protein
MRRLSTSAGGVALLALATVASAQPALTDARAAFTPAPPDRSSVPGQRSVAGGVAAPQRRVYGEWVSTTEPPPTSCTDCGACCHGDGPHYVRVSGIDYHRLGDAAAEVTQFLGNRSYMVLVERRCVALSPGFEGRACGCTVYATRPEPCRTLERGSPECRAAIDRERHFSATATTLPKSGSTVPEG